LAIGLLHFVPTRRSSDLHGGRVSGHQQRAVSVAPAARPAAREYLLRGRRRPVDLFLARGGGGQYPALREGFSRREDHPAGTELRSEEHTSELQSRENLVC